MNEWQWEELRARLPNLTDEQFAALRRRREEERRRITTMPNPLPREYEGISAAPHGYVYLLTNPSLAGLVKVGRTDREPAERVAELSASTSIPTPFELVYWWRTEHSHMAEAHAHRLLREAGVARRKEFFKGDPHAIGVIVAKACADCDHYLEHMRDRATNPFHECYGACSPHKIITGPAE